ncbi:aspartokinase [Metarhizium guizhouense ARSEF 977]|uniref:Aspartokinase n=1 Tax=Metarhizium guizhouense (strain ARSEF 977) TaxID=1276136 RepID=A0A0B4HSP3_METGA|nr:aspartokinase [Metarhizium guizhouense ARSEF 977]
MEKTDLPQRPDTVHKKLVQQVTRNKVPVRTPKGSSILFSEEALPGPGSVASASLGPSATLTAKRNMLVIQVRPFERCCMPRFLGHVFAALDKCKLSIETTATSAGCISVSLRPGVPYPRGVNPMENYLQEIVRDLSRHGSVSVFTDKAVVTVEDGHAVDNPEAGLVHRALSMLGNNDMNIAMMSQGTVHTSASQ